MVFESALVALLAACDAGPDDATRMVVLYDHEEVGSLSSTGADSTMLRTVLERIAEYPINRIEELLPWNLASALAEELREAA